MVSLLTIIDLSLGSKGNSTVLWIIIEKLKQYPLEPWVLGCAYVSAAVWPLVKFIRTDLEEWHESRTKLIFYPPLAQTLLAGAQKEPREKELSMRAFEEGWQDARPLKVVHGSRASANTAL